MIKSAANMRSGGLLVLITVVIFVLSVRAGFEPVRALPASGDARGGSEMPGIAAEEPVEEAAAADLQIRMFGPVNGEVAAGTDITYTIVVDNFGPDEAANVVLRDLVNSNGAFSLVSASSDRAAVCSPAPGEFSGHLDLTCTLEQPLEAMSAQTNGRWLVTIVLRANESQGITALANVRSDTADPDLANNEAIASYEITERADLALTVNASGENLTAACPPETALVAQEVNAGGRLLYELAIANAGPSRATAVVLKQQLPDGFHFSGVETSSGACSVDIAQNMISCGLGRIAAGSAVTIAVKGLADGGLEDGHTLLSNALVTSATYDEDNGNDLASDVTMVQRTTDLRLTMAAAGNVVSGWDSDSNTAIVKRAADEVSAGDRLQYTYTIQNGGLLAVTNAQIQGRLPFEPDYVSGATCMPAEDDPGVTVCTAASVPAGGEQIVVLSGLTSSMLAEGEAISQKSGVSSGIRDVCAENDGAENLTVANTVADYALGLEPAPQTGAESTQGITQGLVEVTPGSENRYEVTVGNGGPSAGAGPRVTARLATLNNRSLGEKLVACEPIAPLTGVTCVFEEPDVVRVTGMVAGDKVIISPVGGYLPADSSYRFYLLTEVAGDFLEQDESGALPFAAVLKGATTDFHMGNNDAETAVQVVKGPEKWLLPFITR